MSALSLVGRQQGTESRRGCAGWDGTEPQWGCHPPRGAALGAASPGWWPQGQGCVEGAATAARAAPVPSSTFPGQGGHPRAEGCASVQGRGRWCGHHLQTLTVEQVQPWLSHVLPERGSTKALVSP